MESSITLQNFPSDQHCSSLSLNLLNAFRIIIDSYLVMQKPQKYFLIQRTANDHRLIGSF